MLDNIPIRRRLTGLLVLLGLTALVVVVYAGQTISILSKASGMEKRKPGVASAPAELAEYETRLASLDHEIKSLRSRGVNIESHAGFIDYSEKLCGEYDLRMFSLPVEERMKMQDYDVASIPFSIEGGYHDILKFIHRMEQVDRVASVENVTFSAETLRINDEKTKVLIASLHVNRLLQNEK